MPNKYISRLKSLTTPPNKYNADDKFTFMCIDIRVALPS